MLALLLGGAAFADEVHLVSGGSILGLVTEEADKIVIETGSGTIAIDSNDVMWIDRTKRSKFEDFLDRYSQVKELSDAEAYCSLALWAQENGIGAYVRMLVKRATELDSSHEGCVKLPENPIPKPAEPAPPRPAAKREPKPKPALVKVPVEIIPVGAVPGKQAPAYRSPYRGGRFPPFGARRPSPFRPRR